MTPLRFPTTFSARRPSRNPISSFIQKKPVIMVPTSAPWKVILTQSTRRSEVHGVVFPAYRVADLAGIKCRLVLWSDDSFQHISFLILGKKPRVVKPSVCNILLLSLAGQYQVTRVRQIFSLLNFYGRLGHRIWKILVMRQWAYTFLWCLWCKDLTNRLQREPGRGHDCCSRWVWIRDSYRWSQGATLSSGGYFWVVMLR